MTIKFYRAKINVTKSPETSPDPNLPWRCSATGKCPFPTYWSQWSTAMWWATRPIRDDDREEMGA